MLYRCRVELEFSGEIWFWRGPAPHHFVTVPAAECRALGEIARAATYGWGMIPVTATTGSTTWTTSLFPKDGRYIVPLKVAVRKAEQLSLGDIATIRLKVSI